MNGSQNLHKSLFHSGVQRRRCGFPYPDYCGRGCTIRELGNRSMESRSTSAPFQLSRRIECHQGKFLFSALRPHSYY